MLIRSVFCLFCLSFATGVFAGGGSNLVLLDANFNDRPINVQIGTGGAVVGEPVSLSGGLAAVVTPVPLPTPSLRLSQSSTGSARFARFEFLGGEEVSSGALIVFFVLRPAALDRFLVGIRENDGAGRNFADLTFLSSGSIVLADSNPGVSIGNYVAGQTLVFEFRYDMDAGTYDLRFNGQLVVDDRAHGVADRGVGSVLVGTDPASASQWFLDDLSVTRPEGVFGSGFEDTP
jgi:hypothetical protein